MTETYFPFDSGSGASVMESQWSQMARFWLSTGVFKSQLNELQAYADSSAMTVKVKSGQAWIMGHFYQTDAEIALPIAVSDPSNPRTDRVVCRVDWVNNNIGLHVLQGTVNGPEPALTQNTAMWEIPICKVNVRAGEVTVAAGDVTDERAFTGFPQSFTAIANSIALRDANGDLTANKFHGSLNGNADTATNATSSTSSDGLKDYISGSQDRIKLAWNNNEIQFQVDTTKGGLPVELAQNANNLGGQAPSYYATAGSINALSSSSGTWTPAYQSLNVPASTVINIASVSSGANMFHVGYRSGYNSLNGTASYPAMIGTSASNGNTAWIVSYGSQTMAQGSASTSSSFGAYITVNDGGYQAQGYFRIYNGYLQFVTISSGTVNTNQAQTYYWGVR